MLELLAFPHKKVRRLLQTLWSFSKGPVRFRRSVQCKRKKWSIPSLSRYKTKTLYSRTVSY